MKAYRRVKIQLHSLSWSVNRPSRQLHVPAALFLGKKPPVPTGWAPGSVRTFCRREKSLAMPGFEPKTVQAVANRAWHAYFHIVAVCRNGVQDGLRQAALIVDAGHRERDRDGANQQEAERPVEVDALVPAGQPAAMQTINLHRTGPNCGFV